MTFLQWMRYLLSLPMNLLWPGETPEERAETDLYDFVEIAWFYMAFSGMFWLLSLK